MFMDWKTKHSKDVNSPSMEIPFKFCAEIFIDTDKVILTFISKGKEIKIICENFEKEA